MTLQEYMKGRKPQFRPVPYYFPDGDLLHCYAKDDPGYTEQLSPYLMIHRSIETDEIVGVTVAGAGEAVHRRPGQ